MIYTFAFILAFIISVVVTPLVVKLAQRIKLLDIPRGRHQHKAPTPLLGGLAIFVAFFVVAAICAEQLTATNLNLTHWLGVFLGAMILMIGGYLDDKYQLGPRYQIIFPLLAVLAVVMGGIGIEKVTNPLGGFLQLDTWKIPLFAFAGEMRYFVVIADSFTVLWLLGMIYTTKLLDGVDGLVTGIASIASIIIFIFTQSVRYFQPDVSLAAIILAGACLGFLLYNWNPAKIFLGESGSMLLGFLLGVLSIISGGKIAIALLIMGLPILDVIWTIIRRLAAKKNPFASPDRQHLHFLLLDSGLGVKKTVLFFYAFAAVFGLSALFLQSRGKLIALAVLGLVMVLMIAIFYYLDKKPKLR